MKATVTVLDISADFAGGQVSKKVLAELGITTDSAAVTMKSEMSITVPRTRVYLNSDMRNSGIKLNQRLARELCVEVGDQITIQT